MKAYVIKDGMFYARGTTLWVDELPFASIFDKKEDAEKLKNKIKKEFDNCNPQVITLTICEDDLEDYIESIEKINDELTEERYIFKKALELACEELETRDEGKTHARLFIQKIKNNYLGDNVGYEDYFIQQAKESEKDEN